VPGDAGADPLIYGEMATEPVVLGGHIGERPLSGQLERGDAGGLVSLNVGVHWHDPTG
jgi:hypothetical protein